MTRDANGFFACPYCGANTLESKSDGLHCPACSKTYPFSYGLANFSFSKVAHWEEAEEGIMRGLLNSFVGIDDALIEMLNKSDPKLKEYLTGYALGRNRAGWKFLSSLNPGGRVLDLGCGWGNITLSLASNAGEIFAADVVPERVALTVRRLQEKGFLNVTGCVASGWPRLPFPDSFFDLVVVNGVLEWVPGSPRDAQSAFLKEISRVLKPAGQLYLGIENRFGIGYFFGRIEEHTKLRFISLLPRFLGGLYHLMRKGSEYRAYTYSRGQLARFLKCAGFPDSVFYLPYPDYRDFYRIAALDDPVWMSNSFAPRTIRGKLAKLINMKTGFLRNFSDSFAVLSAKSEAPVSFIERLRLHLIKRNELGAQARIDQYFITSTARVNIRFIDGDKKYLLSLALDRRAAKRIQMAVSARNALSSVIEGSDIAADLKEFTHGEFEAEPYILRRFYKYENAAFFYKSDSASRIMECSIDWLRKFHSLRVEEAPFAPALLLEGGFQKMLSFMPEEVKGAYGRFLQACAGKLFKASLVHGDFRMENILMDTDMKVQKVIDWDLAMLKGFPLWDVFSLLIDIRFMKGGSWSLAYKGAVEECLRLKKENGAFARYLEAMGIGDADFWLSALTFPLVQLYYKMNSGDQHPAVIIDDNFASVISYFLERAVKI